MDSGLKISKIMDDFTSAEPLIAKGRADPLFVPRETDTMFILTAHLKGYERESIKIEIYEDGNRISVSGGMLVQATVMVGLKVYKREIEIEGFRKAFKIPDWVIWAQIKARFNEEESVLTISMPKSVKGFSGIRVEEVEEEGAARGNSKLLEITRDGIADGGTLLKQDREKIESTKIVPYQVIQPKEKSSNFPLGGKIQIFEQQATADGISGGDRKMQGKELKEDKQGQETDQIENPNMKQVSDKEDQEVRENKAIQKRENDKEEIQKRESDKEESQKRETGTDIPASSPPEKRSKLCVPIVAGSAVLVSVIVIVIHLIRTKNHPRKKKQ